MIFGRPPALVIGAFQAVLGAVVLVLANLVPPIDVPSAVVAGVVIAFGAVIALIANQPPTVNPGDTVKVTTPAGQPTYETTIATPPAQDPPPVPKP